MARLVWTPQSREDVEAIGSYIGRDSERAARAMVGRIVDEGARLVEFPRSGRMVPEKGDDAVREIIVGAYRLIYRLRDHEAVEVLTVLHGARRLDPTDLNG